MVNSVAFVKTFTFTLCIFVLSPFSTINDLHSSLITKVFLDHIPITFSTLPLKTTFSNFYVFLVRKTIKWYRKCSTVENFLLESRHQENFSQLEKNSFLFFPFRFFISIMIVETKFFVSTVSLQNKTKVLETKQGVSLFKE